MVLNAGLFLEILIASLSRFSRHFLLWLIILLPATLPSILLNTLAWHEEAIGRYIISNTSLKTFHLLDNFSYVLILAGIWVYWLALMLALRDLERGLKVRPFKKFAEGFKLIPADFILKAAATGRILLWSLCLIVPGFYKAVLYSLAKFSFIEENKKPFEALARSHALLKGKFIHYLDYWLYIGFIIFFVFMVQKLFIDQIYNIFLLIDMQPVLRWIENFEIVFVGLCHTFLIIFLHNLYLRLIKD